MNLANPYPDVSVCDQSSRRERGLGSVEGDREGDLLGVEAD